MTRDYFLTILEGSRNYLVYQSEHYKLSEMDILLLLKICLVNGRSKRIGRKILSIYKDSSCDSQEDMIAKLQKIGIICDDETPIKLRKSDSK